MLSAMIASLVPPEAGKFQSSKLKEEDEMPENGNLGLSPLFYVYEQPMSSIPLAG